MSFKKNISLFLALCMIISVFAVAPMGVSAAQTEVAQTGAGMYGLVDDIQQGQILQCWNWSYRNIAANMSLIAQQGFSAIQTSPIQATKETTKESYSTFQNASSVLYQPVAFNIETNDFNALGTKGDFEYMCSEADKYGVKVIVDVVFNNMATDGANNTIHSWVPSELKDNPDCWHDITKNVSDFNNRYDVTHYCLGGLPDLNTANATVQNHCTNFLKEAIDAGADGFRFDSAMHIETDWDAEGTSSDFWKNVITAATAYAQETKGFTPYYYGEMLSAPAEGLSIEAYTRYMSVSDPGTSDTIRNAVCNGDASAAVTSSVSYGAAQNKVVQWTESHDNHKDNGTNSVSENNINKTWAIVGSRNEVCGMYLARPVNINTTLIGSADRTSWAYPEVKAVNTFKNLFAGQSEHLSSYQSFACVERGTSGMVIVNTNGTASASMSVPVHKMAAGTYTDAITGNTFTVSNGFITGDIGDTGIAVIYNTGTSGTFTKGNVTEVSIAGDFNGWDASADRMIALDGNTASTTMFLTEGTYGFKLTTTNGIWMGNSGTIEDTTTATSAIGWEMSSANQDNCTLKASGGKYTFTFNVSTGMLVVDYENTEDTTSDIYLKGSFNDWGTNYPMEYSSEDNVVTVTTKLTAGTYTFKLHNSALDVWYGNTGTISDTTGTNGWVMETGAGDCTLTATGGTYKFSFNLSTQQLTVTTDAVVTPTEPPTTEPPAETVYYLMGDFNGWSEVTSMTATDEAGIVSVTIDLEGGEYGFKVKSGDSWYGNSGTIEDTTTATSDIGWEMSASNGDCKLKATGGTYTFKFNTETKYLIVLHTPVEADKYTVTFKDYNGMIISEQTVEAGASATAPQDPVRAADAQYTYTFKQWDKDFTNVTENLVVTAVYDSVVNKYTVAFMDYDGTVLGTQTVEYGSAATAPETPERDGYIFAGWDTAFDNITKDTTVTATYRVRGVSYTVIFKDHDGTVLSTQYVEAGSAATAPEVPEREGYTFAGWDTAFDNITADVVITATYTELSIFLMGTFNDWQQKDAMVETSEDSNLVVAELRLEPGKYYFKIKQDDIWFGNPGVIEDTTDKTSETGWAMEIDKDNCTLEATGGIYTFIFDLTTAMLKVKHVEAEYTVTFVDYDGTVLSTQKVKIGSSAKTPAYPTREKDAQYTYYFTGWDVDYSNIKEDTVVTATYLAVANKFTVTFADYDGTVLRTQLVEYGCDAVAPVSPSRAGYIFIGWDKNYTGITEDITVTAQYKTNSEPVVTTTGSLKIDVISSTGFKISVGGSAFRPQGMNYINSQMDINVSVTVTANQSSNSTFVGWVNAKNGQILTEDYTYTFTTTGMDYLKAMYVAEYDDINMVVFMNDKAASGLGQILDMQYYSAGDAISFPDIPSQVGFDFYGWNMTEEEIQAELSQGNDVTVLAVWLANEVYVEVSVINGKADGDINDEGLYRANYAVRLTADEAPEGMKFAYWKVNGVPKGYSETLDIYPSMDTTAEAVYVAEDEDIEYAVIVNIDNIDTTSISDKNRFYYSWYVPESEMKVTYVSSGILAVKKEAYTGTNLTINTTDENVYHRNPGEIAQTAVNASSWTKSDVVVGETWVAVAYVQYRTESGEVQVAYSELKEATK